MARGGRGTKRCHFPFEGDTIGNAITRKCKLGMLTYISMDISGCPPEWYQSAKFRVLAHALPIELWMYVFPFRTNVETNHLVCL